MEELLRKALEWETKRIYVIRLIHSYVYNPVNRKNLMISALCLSDLRYVINKNTDQTLVLYLSYMHSEVVLRLAVLITQRADEGRSIFHFLEDRGKTYRHRTQILQQSVDLLLRKQKRQADRSLWSGDGRRRWEIQQKVSVLHRSELKWHLIDVWKSSALHVGLYIHVDSWAIQYLNTLH